MSTVVLARKYRPRSFDQMVGQEHVVRALGNALEHNRLHHAYLFTGTRGIGKTTVSRILAKSLNCTGADGRGGITSKPCGVCTACTEIDADRYIDYIELDAASNRGIDEVRDLIERAAYKPGIGRFKVFMIDEAHQLTKDGFNALLKTLEEPPEYLKFVLATTDPEKMLPTVLSRCLQFNLRPMPPEVVREHLAHVLAAEGVPFDDGALRLLGRAARGSMRDALSLADQAIAYGGGRLEEAVVRSMLGAVERTRAASVVEALSRRDGPALLAAIDELRLRGLSAAGTLDEVAALLQQMAVAQAVPDALDGADPDQAEALRLAPAMAADETQLLYSMAVQGRAELALMSDEYAALTMVLLRFLAFAPAGSPSAAASASAGAPGMAVESPGRGAAAAARPAAAVPPARPAPAAVPARPGPAPGPAPARVPAQVPAQVPAASPRPPAPRAVAPAASEPPPWLDEVPPEALDESEPRAAPLRAPAPPAMLVPAPPPAGAGAEFERTELGDRWSAVVSRLVEQGLLAALLRELAWQAQLVGVDTAGDLTTWRLRVEREPLRLPSLRDKLAALLSAELGTRQAIEIEAGVVADTPARREAAERARRQGEAEQSIRDDDAVQELMRQFKTARIVPGSIKPL